MKKKCFSELGSPFLTEFGGLQISLHSNTFIVILLYMFSFLVRNNGKFVKRK